MDWRIVREVRGTQDMSQVCKGHALNPRVLEDVLRVVEFEEVKLKVASVQPESRYCEREERERVYLPRARQDGPRSPGVGRFHAFGLRLLGLGCHSSF